MDEKIERLETLLAFQDDGLKELSGVVYAQQRQIDVLEKHVEALTGKVRQLAALLGNDLDNAPPPHYGE